MYVLTFDVINESVALKNAPRIKMYMTNMTKMCKLVQHAKRYLVSIKICNMICSFQIMSVSKNIFILSLKKC